MLLIHDGYLMEPDPQVHMERVLGGGAQTSPRVPRSHRKVCLVKSNSILIDL